MEVLINELSLHKQFGSVSQFIDTALPEFLQMYTLLDTMCIELLKSNRLYASHITTDTTLHDVMILKNVDRVSDELRKFKQLVAKCIDAPYWEDDKQHSNTDYIHNQQIVTETSLAEAYARNAILVSFAPSDYQIAIVEVVSENQSKPIL